jgi:hypothetical protein
MHFATFACSDVNALDTILKHARSGSARNRHTILGGASADDGSVDDVWWMTMTTTAADDWWMEDGIGVIGAGEASIVHIHESGRAVL